MSEDADGGAEQALEVAILGTLGADAGVKAVLGDPPRVFEAAETKPAYPYLEILRHEARPAGSADAEASEHRVDLGIVSRGGGREEARAALAAVRSALTEASLSMEGWRCILMTPLFADMVRDASGAYRIVLRVRSILEPA